MTWVGPETVTSLIEAHGTDAGDDPAAGLGRDTGLAGPRARSTSLDALRDVPPDRMPPDVIDGPRRRRSRRASSRWATPASSTTPTRRSPTCRPTTVRPTRPPATPTSGATAWRRTGSTSDVPGEGRGLAPFPQAADDTAVDLD